MPANDDADYKRFTARAQRGIRGEAFFESLIVGHAIPNRIARQNDLGVDFLCEWVCGDRPTGILFVAQVKTSARGTVVPKSDGLSELNGLPLFSLTGADKADDVTLHYWKGLGLPAYLFYVIEPIAGGTLECYYKRYTPLLDGFPSADDKTGSRSFHLVSDGARFRAFAEPQDAGIGGFARDLIVDFARLSYFKGHVVELTPARLGFWPFVDSGDPDIARHFRDPLKWHRKKIQEICNWTGSLLSLLPAESASAGQ